MYKREQIDHEPSSISSALSSQVPSTSRIKEFPRAASSTRESPIYNTHSWTLLGCSSFLPTSTNAQASHPRFQNRRRRIAPVAYLSAAIRSATRSHSPDGHPDSWCLTLRREPSTSPPDGRTDVCTVYCPAGNLPSRPNRQNAISRSEFERRGVEG